ncbi:MAG: PAS domain S-box protein [Methanolinea sp.]|jgi:PAS domain S-box-containing protein|nr:PAS domain S-box protein [Methanolinea sp.]
MTNLYRILYVDDEPALLDIVRLYLEKKKRFIVDTATSAGEALKKMQCNPPYDAVVCDYQMPVMDGIGFLRVLRKHGDDIPFIIFTGKGREDIVIQALNEGADFYLQKGGDPASQFAELAHVIQKVVRQKRIESSIRDMERREADILNFLPDATFAIDLHGTVIAWNRAMEKMTGIPADEILGRGDYEYALPFYHERRPILIDLVLKADPGTEAKYPYIRREGETLISEIFIPHLNGGKGAHLWFLASPLYNSRGEVAGAIESIRDVSEWKDVEKEMEERGRFLSTLIANLPGFAYRCRNDRNWTMEYISDGCRDVTGYEPSDFIGNATLAFNDIIHPDYRDVLWNLWQKNLAEQRVFEYEYPITTRSGQTRWVWERGRGIFSEEGTLLYLEGFITDITVRKKTEDELRRSEEQLALAIEGSGAGLWDWKVQTGELSCNERWAGIVGYTLDELAPLSIGTWNRLVHPDDLEVSNSLLRKHFAQEIPFYECEVRMRHKDGHWVWILDRGKVTEWDGEGRPVRMTGTHLDITERKRIEEELRESREILHSFIGNLPVGLYRNTPGPRGEYILANPYVARLHGFGTLDELFTHPASDLYEDPSERLAFSDELVRAGSVFGRELHLKRKNGERFWGRVSAVAVRDEKGNIKYFDGVIEDITEQKKAEKAFRESEKKYRDLLEKLPEQVIVHREGHILYANPATFRTLGYNPEEVINRHVLEFIPPEYHPQVVETIRKRATGQPPEHYDIEVIGKDGSRRTVRVSGRPITFEGEPATLIVLFDITERKRAEGALQQASRKIALLNSVTRHDISNHLLVLTGLLDLLQDSKEPSERAALLEKVRRAAARIFAAIQFTKDYEQIGGSDPQWQDIHDLVEVAKADFLSPSLTIENEIPRGLLVFSDSMMAKVITNLIDNAVRHGGKVTSIRFSTAEEGENLLVSCGDDGAGIPDGEKEMIFERGYGRNTGWGLFLAREILSITGMTIREDGVPGKGARFVITVPKGSWRQEGE